MNDAWSGDEGSASDEEQSSERSERDQHYEPRPIGESLDRLLRSAKGGAGRRELGGVFGQWDAAVGAVVAAHVQPVRLDRKILTVAVDDPAWVTQVRLLHDELLARVMAVSGVELDGIEVRVARPSRWR